MPKRSLVFLAGLLATPTVLHAQPNYKWSTNLPGRAIEYGVPDTDDRSFRIDCAEHGGLEISAPSPLDLSGGAGTKVVFEAQGAKRMYLANIFNGDGPQFVTAVSYADPTIAALLNGYDVRVNLGGYQWTVPGARAARVLRPLIAACRHKHG